MKSWKRLRLVSTFFLSLLRTCSSHMFFCSEETTEDLRAQMYSIQENEIDQTRELTAFLDLELNFVEQYLGVLKDLKSGWSVSR